VLPPLPLLPDLLGDVVERAAVDISEEVVAALVPEDLAEVRVVIAAVLLLWFIGLAAYSYKMVGY